MSETTGRFGTINLKVNGKDVTADIDGELSITDISDDMDVVAAKMAYWGALWAEAEAENERVDAAYRYWRADFGRSVMEAEGGKAPEWKIKQEIEGSPKFRTYKEGIALALRNVTLLKTVYESFRVKASTLQSKGAMARAELDATGMHTKREAREATVELAKVAMGKTTASTKKISAA